MKAPTLSLGLCFGLASANIIFEHVPLSCDRSKPGYTGCLRGQHCTDNGLCESSDDAVLHPLSFIKRAFSTDGKCGPNNGDLLCDPNSNVYSHRIRELAALNTGTPSLLVPFGAEILLITVGLVAFLGAQLARPLVAMGGVEQTLVARLVMQMAHLGAVAVHMGSVDQLLDSEPVISTQTNGPKSGGGVTTDGNCGAANGGTTCGDWPLGSCCSMYGFCGNTASHCGDGCQSGPCIGGVKPQAPGPSPAPVDPNLGSFNVVGQSGVPAMHAGLLPNGRVFFLDKIENFTQLKLPSGFYAYSSEYDPITNTAVPLAYKTNSFCAGGTFLADGSVISVGGNGPLDFIDPTVGDGFDGIRYLSRSPTDASLNGQSWSEPGNKLSSKRWYATAQVLPDGSIFVASGSLNGLDPTVLANNNPTYEILSPGGVSNGQSIPLNILVKNQPYYHVFGFEVNLMFKMYPFIHLLGDGSLYIFVSKSSELFNVQSGTTTNTFPDLPGDFRTYPNTGGSVLLPLSSANNWAPSVIICGGGAFQDITSPTDPSCGRINPLDANANWEMDSMPEGRGMIEGTLLPDGKVIWLNGANHGAQGFGIAKDPTFEALIYDPAQPLGKRWTAGASSTIARLYHSVALLLLDGTILITGSNPVEQPILTPTSQNPFVTEFRVEIYTPPYLQGANANRRPTNVQLSSKTLVANGNTFVVKFDAPTGAQGAKVALYHGGFITHSVHMGHRMLFLDNAGFQTGQTAQELTVTMPPNRNLAPPGPYVVYVTVDGVPAIGQFVQVS
ncbi:hypothetical protein FGG08_006683 [Glutinoglossum americanum]|uniref:Chitin-binding type-1 domain-containing protein n=1 Tax=Glutinoglossum americanum TaxID=1670608 RepID=A0A9P8L0Q2_9PEZI|nr:hypothetical protein FGG08_006683 [Glutinoglossum americanum]